MSTPAQHAAFRYEVSNAKDIHNLLHYYANDPWQSVKFRLACVFKSGVSPIHVSIVQANVRHNTKFAVVWTFRA